MSEALSANAPPARALSLKLGLMLFAMCALSVALVWLSGGNAGAGIAPVAAVTIVYAICTLPMRYTVITFIFLGLTMENPQEGFGGSIWSTPLRPIGGLLLSNMNQVTHINAMKFSGTDLLLALLFGLLVYRRTKKSKVDAGQLSPAIPMRKAALFSWIALLFLWGMGIVRGGDFSHSLWQIKQCVTLPMFFFLVGASTRGPRDLRALGSVVVISALYRAVLAVYIHHHVFLETGEVVPYSTSHADSMLFAGAMGILLAAALEYHDRKHFLLLVLCTPIIMYGMKDNNRRLVYVELAFVMLSVALLSGWSPIKRKLTQLLVYSLPLLLIYTVIGWGNPTGVFAPVKTIRSIVDSKADASTAWRDLEDLNLIYTVGEHPLLGPGFGHKYNEIIQLPDISRFFEAYRYHPHNGVLGLWAFTGWLGFGTMWLYLVVGVFLAVRSYRCTRSPLLRTAALSSVGLVIVYINQVYGDIGLGSTSGVFLVAPALAVAGQLAVVTGAWPSEAMKAASRAPSRVLEAPPHAVPAG